MSITRFLSAQFVDPLRNIYHDYPDVPGWVITVIIIAVALFIIFVVIRVALYAVRPIRWITSLRPCQHCRTRTTDRADGTHDHCTPGEACCARCTMQHRFDEASVIHCPLDGTVMTIAIRGRDHLTRHCPDCGATFQEPGVLDAILQEVKYEGVNIGPTFFETVLK